MSHYRHPTETDRHLHLRVYLYIYIILHNYIYYLGVIVCLQCFPKLHTAIKCSLEHCREHAYQKLLKGPRRHLSDMKSNELDRCVLWCLEGASVQSAGKSAAGGLTC